MSSTNNVHILELSAYTQPEIVENTRSEWVEYGKDNDYYNWLIERYRNSPTLNAVVNNVSKLTYGRGLYAKNASLRPNDFAQMKVLFTNETLRNVALDFKLFGNACFQVIYSDNRKKIGKVEHLPMNLLRPEKCNKEGKIEAYYYSDNWAEYKKFPPKRVPVFGTSKEGIELVIIGGYAVGRKYFNAPDYEGCLDYAVLEEKIAEYLVNEVTNGFSGTKVVNFNNGIPSEEEQRQTVGKVKRSLTGSMGDKVIVAFNLNGDQKTTVDDIPLNDAPEHYQYLSDEARNKILAGNNITSSMLIGITPDGQGFSSNADEIDTAAKYFHNTVIKYYQDAIIEGIDKILAYNNISLDLFFRRLNLFEDIEAVAQQQEETQLKKQTTIETIINMYGEDDDLNGWELVDEREVNYDEEDDLDTQLIEHFKPKETILHKIWRLATGTATPNQKSEQDKELDGFYFKVRYQYTGNPAPERDFCRGMMRANKVYRKEDILRMSTQIVNAGFGEGGADTYSIWLYKGGARCHHKWVRRTYVSTSKNASIGSKDTTETSTNKAEKFGYRVRNEKEVGMIPNDMPLKGFSPNNPNLPSDVR